MSSSRIIQEDYFVTDEPLSAQAMSHPLYAHLRASESIDAFGEADEIEANAKTYETPYLLQKADERRREALELMALSFGPSFDPNDKRMHIH